MRFNSALGLVTINNIINHVALVLDASTSMASRAADLIRVADSQIAYLARRSQELDQETRVTIYVFADTAKCLVYDKDVLRLPTIGSLYRANGMTALVDAALLSMSDLAETAQRYGDHSFLIFVLTDGQENRSKNHPTALQQKLNSLAENWTVATLVPDQLGKREAQQFGFPRDNIAIWDAQSTRGVNEVGETIRRATDNFMVARATGVRGSRSLFTAGADVVNDKTVKSTLEPLVETRYDTIRVHANRIEIKPFIESRGLDYQIGKVFYQLARTETKASEKVQPGKVILIREKKTGKVFHGPDARKILSLPDTHEVRVRPDENTDYDIFIQSTSVNRKLALDTDVIVMR